MALPAMIETLASVRWIHGAPDCARSDDPLIQVVRADADTYVLRVSKCFSFEANFIYLLVGRERAILFDTGGPPDPGSRAQILPLRETVDDLLDAHPASPGPGGTELIVAHTHGHGDHVFWDGQFTDRPRTTMVGHGLPEVQAFWALPDWPDGQATFELGGRPLTAIPTPGHETAHIAVFDHRTGLLLTGDVLYPGLLTVRDWAAFRATARRLRDFSLAHPVRLALGNHVEMSRTPGALYPLGSTWQPDEHPLPLDTSHIEALHRLCETLGDAPRGVTEASFAIGLVARPSS